MHNTNVHQYNLLGLASIILAAIAAIITLFIPTPPNANPETFHSIFFITTLVIVTHFGGAILFVLGLRGFSAKLKRAYRLLVIGFTSLALGFVQLPLMHLDEFKDSPWAAYGLVAIPFMVSIGCIYAGVRGFARLFGVRNLLTSAWLATLIAIVISFLSMLLPHATPNIPITDTQIVIVKFVQMLPAMFNLWSVILCFQARKRAGSLYIPATAWLCTYLAFDSLCSLSGFVIRLGEPGQNVMFDNGYTYILYAVGGVVLLKAGIEFNKIRFGRDTLLPPEEQTFYGRPKAHSVSRDAGVATILTYLAGLASDTRAIDPILDEMRKLTSIIEPDAPLNDNQQRELAQTYLRLETYLADKEPVRPFTREELHSTVQTRFARVLEDNPVFARVALKES